MRTAETDLREIKNLMERSSRFISLSGLSGIFAGIYALVGTWLAYCIIENTAGPESLMPLAGLAMAVLVLSLVTAIFLTTRNARKKNQKVWDKLSQRMLLNLGIPLLSGGIFLLILLYREMYSLAAPVMLIFYGLALINGSKYTLNDIRYLGLLEIALGLIAVAYTGYDLLFWGAGFGVLHIIYGALMYWKYER